MKYAKSNLCQLGWISCVGCCGRKFSDKLSVAKGIEKNTLEFKHHRISGKDHTHFMNRSKDLRECGICFNVVYDVDKNSLYCPLHPEHNNGKDHRLDHHFCDIMHLCKTSFFFDLWDDERKEAFMKFLKTKKKKGELDWYTYSIGMANDSFLQEFEGMKWD